MIFRFKTLRNSKGNHTFPREARSENFDFPLQNLLNSGGSPGCPAHPAIPRSALTLRFTRHRSGGRGRDELALLGTCAEGSPGNDPPGADPDRCDSPRVAIRSVPLRAAGAAAGAGLRRWGRARMTKSTFKAWLRARGRAAAGNEARGAGRGWGAGQGGEACLLAVIPCRGERSEAPSPCRGGEALPTYQRGST